MTSVLRPVIAIVILGLLARSARVAWGNRTLAAQVWRRIRLHHLLGSVALLGVVIAVAATLLTFVPLTGLGLGSLVGLTGNAVFAPVEQVAVLDNARPPEAGPGLVVPALTAAFLGLLLAMFPWLAYVEERMFRMGLERQGAVAQAWTALRFGLIHLVMLVPIAAALAIAVAGYWYGRIYLRSYRRLTGDELFGPAEARREAVLASTVWHATFNSLIVVLLLVLLVVEGSLI